MGIFDWFSKRAIVTDYSDGLKGGDLILALGGSQTSSGVTVNQTTAMQLSAVQACVRVISEDLASLPFFVYQRTEDGRDRATDHPLYKILHDQPNPDMTSFVFREAMQACVLLWGNSYAFIEKVNERAIALWPLPPNQVQPFRRNGDLFYTVKVNGREEILTPDQILHIPGLSFDGIKGRSPIEQAADVLGFSLAADRFGQKFFQNGAIFTGVLEVDKGLSDEAIAKLKASWSKMYQGVGNAHKTPLLEEGIKFTPMSVPPEQAQFLELRKFQTIEIARLFRCQPHKIMDLDRATFSNIEEQGIDYVRSTLRSWIVKWEQEVNRKLFFEAERGTFFAEIKVDALLRGDQTTRFSNYATAIQNGWTTPKRVAILENLSTEGLSDVPVTPLNMAPVSEDKPEDEPETEDTEQDTEEQEEDARSRYRLVIEDAARRVITKELNAIKRAAKKFEDDQHGMITWAKSFYATHQQTIRTTFRPVMEACFRNRAGEIIDKIVERHTSESIEALTKAVHAGDIETFLETQRRKANEEIWTDHN